MTEIEISARNHCCSQRAELNRVVGGRRESRATVSSLTNLPRIPISEGKVIQLAPHPLALLCELLAETLLARLSYSLLRVGLRVGRTALSERAAELILMLRF